MKELFPAWFILVPTRCVGTRLWRAAPRIRHGLAVWLTWRGAPVLHSHAARGNERYCFSSNYFTK